MLRRYDKGGDQFYDMISALHKSVRGSDPDAALYWLARMLDGGADPRYVARRAAAHGQRGHRPGRPAGTAPGADAAEVYERLGSPEGELALAEAVVYLAVAPKSNAVYKPGTRCANSCVATAPGRCPCTCATRRRADEGPGPWRRLPLRP
jgi:putative ATPase